MFCNGYKNKYELELMSKEDTDILTARKKEEFKNI